MNLKDIVIDYEYAVKLKELGIKQESLFSFCSDKEYFENELKEDGSIIYEPLTYRETKMARAAVSDSTEFYSAFTSDELLEILYNWNSSYDFYIKEFFEVKYVKDINSKGCFIETELLHSEDDEKLSNALAKMLIYLIEKKYYKVGV